jgi:chromosome segregation ATPase
VARSEDQRLRAIDATIARVENRLDRIIARIADCQREAAAIQQGIAEEIERFERIDQTLRRIERRLDPVEDPTI